MPDEPAPPSAMGHSRRLLATLTLLSPLALLLALELALRLAGFGSSYPLFVDAPGMPGYRQANPDLIQRYYGRSPELAIDVVHFRSEKPSESYRVVVQGGSTAAGFPYGRWGGLAGMLGDRLEMAFPEREIEVISTAMAGVNSYSVLDLVDEIIQIEPDAVLIYAGHNEYLGILGVASALSPARLRAGTLLFLELRRLRVYQLLEWVVAGLRSVVPWGGDGPAATRGTMIGRAAEGARVPFDSGAYHAGIRQLEANLGAALESYGRAGIPVYLATLASNEKDNPPFEGALVTGLDRDAWASGWRMYEDAMEAGSRPAARAALSRLVRLEGSVADAWYALAELELEAGELEAARVAYRHAKDRDELRFRAPEVFNEVIRELADAPGVTLVDVQRHMEAASPTGIVGNELLSEHVHPNARGYFLLADAFYEALSRHEEIGDWSRAPSREDAERDMPVTAIDRMLADHRIRELKADYPFSASRQEVSFPEPSDEVEALAAALQRGELDWLEAMEGLLQLYRSQGRIREASVVARMAAQAYPSYAAPNFSAGMLFLELEQPARARRYLERSLSAEPEDPAALQAMVRAQLALGDEAGARAHLTRLEKLAPRHPLLQRRDPAASPQ
jgi:lysophospholipase L1-like esterase